MTPSKRTGLVGVSALDLRKPLGFEIVTYCSHFVLHTSQMLKNELFEVEISMKKSCPILEFKGIQGLFVTLLDPRCASESFLTI